MAKWQALLGCGLFLAANTLHAQVPPAPANLQPAWVDDFSAVLTWDDVAEAEFYRVYRFDNSAGIWNLVGDQVEVPYFSEAPGQSFPLNYAVSGVNSSGEGASTQTAISTGGQAGYSIMVYQPDLWDQTLSRTNALLRVAASPVSGVRALVELGTSDVVQELYEVHPQFDGFHSFSFNDLSPGTHYFYNVITVGTDGLGLSYFNHFWTLPPNQAPTANDVTVTQYGEWSTYIDLTGTDSDYPPQELSIRLTSQPALGTLSEISGGNGYWSVYYTPNPGARGTDSFQFVISDGETDSAPATAAITGIFLNRAPTAGNLQLSTAEETAISFTLPGVDADGDPLTYIIDSYTAGILSGTPPNLSWTPDQNFNGQMSLSYRVSDGYWDGDGYGSVLLDVTAVDDPPVADPGSTSTDEDAPAFIVPTFSDPDGSGSYTLAIATQAQHGTATVDGIAIIYTPAPNYNGTDSFTYTVSSDGVTSEPALIDVQVLSLNDTPTASSFSISLTEDNSVAITLAGSDVDGDTLSFQIVGAPSNGSLSGTGANLTYTPATNFFGNDSFAYVVNDGQGDSEPATVTISISPVNDAPVAHPINASTAEDTAANIPPSFSDPDASGVFTITITTPPQNGTAVVDGSEILYTPNANYHGTDSFSYSVTTDELASEPAPVSIQVLPINDPPSALSLASSGDEDSILPTTLSGSDPDGDTLGFIIISGPANGTLSGSGSSLNYQPASNFFGSDSFTYKVTDGQADSEPATVTLTINPVDDSPVANPASFVVNEDELLAITLTASDVDGGPQIFSLVTPPQNGVLTGEIPNLFYTPSLNYHGTDTFTFGVSSGAGGSSEGIVNITIAPVNDAPVANNDSLNTAYNAAVAVTLSASDVEGSALTYSLLTLPENGTLSGTAPNLSFQPAIGWSGITSFTFSVNDGSADSGPATVTITVAAPGSTPPAPSSLAATTVSTTQINLAWLDNSNDEDGFRVERSTNGSTWTHVGTVSPGVTAFAATGLSANKTYHFRVRAYNVLGNSSYSNVASARTLK